MIRRLAPIIGLLGGIAAGVGARADQYRPGQVAGADLRQRLRGLPQSRARAGRTARVASTLTGFCVSITRRAANRRPRLPLMCLAAAATAGRGARARSKSRSRSAPGAEEPKPANRQAGDRQSQRRRLRTASLQPAARTRRQTREPAVPSRSLAARLRRGRRPAPRPNVPVRGRPMPPEADRLLLSRGCGARARPSAKRTPAAAPVRAPPRQRMRRRQLRRAACAPADTGVMSRTCQAGARHVRSTDSDVPRDNIPD